ncbi:MAG: restriction endonuclease [Gammaproteobacteria bacterium]|nr:restriction endonuclease [Gammaproteobacteria bacterium]
MVRIESVFTDTALEFVTRPGKVADFLEHPERLAPASQALAAYLAQLEVEGFATRAQGGVNIAWEDLYRLLDHPDHASSIPLFALPPPCEFRPALSSQKALSDADFGIFLDGWRTPAGAPLRGRVERLGATIRIGTEARLLSEAGWRLLEAVRAFARLPVGEKTPERNFREWGRIRALARQAGARLDNFLEKTLVLTPETLQLKLHREEVAGMAVVEVKPTFADAPDNWLHALDQGDAVLARYDLNAANGGIVHVVVEPAVRRVLEQIKRMPQRRAVGAHAAAFLHNPYALLGEEAASVIPPEAFEMARSEAGLAFPDSWAKVRPLITTEMVYDLSGYAPRVEGIGVAKPVYSPYIVRSSGIVWLPDNVEVGIAFKPLGSDQTVLLPFSKEEQAAFGKALVQAEASGQDKMYWPGLPTPISLAEAKSLKLDVDLALKEIGAGDWKDGPPKKPAVKPDQPKGHAPTLLIPHNIETLGYSEEQRRAALAVAPREADLPASLTDELLEHQKIGVAWLQHLWRHSPGYARGGLLADDMGLGKTLQLLAFLAQAFADTPDLPPALVVAPVALLDNWQKEIERFFAPGTFRVLTLYDRELKARRVSREEIDQQLQDERLTRFLRPDWRGNAQLVLTTYETLRDYEFSLAREAWSVMVCDEAQKIKSPAALVTQAAKAMNARFKIAATGTPVENSLTDLWCLFDFIQPGLLGALNEFGRKYKRPIEARTDKERAALEELQNLFAPQLLRRTKDEVVKLPPKTEDPDCRSLPISSTQHRLYAEALAAHRAKIAACDSKKVGQAMLGMLHHLRVLCAHPVPMGQVADTSQPLPVALAASPKLAWLMTTLDNIMGRDEKAIVFTELRDIQRVLQHYIGEHLGVRPVIVNGDTHTRPDKDASRQRLIDAFQAKPGFGVIILSTQAVGFGLNIQAANHVIHYTRPWNPAKEDQATDRAYRIGQDKAVTVYYPTVQAHDYVTFEQRLDELLSSKRELAAKTWLNGADEIQVAEFGNLAADEGLAAFPNRPVGEEELRGINGYALESLCALLWDKQGFHTHQTPKSGDGGVDVVAWKDDEGFLIQCKASSQQGQALGWEAVKDVSAGARAYMTKYPDVHFRRVAITNQYFNETARKQASVLMVELIERDELLALLNRHPIQLQEFLLAVA